MNDGILVIGSLNMDIVIEMQRMPRCGETVLGKSLSYVPGGKGANQACAAGKLCKNTTMLGCVGEDLFGEALIENLKNSGVCVDYLKQTKKNPTGTAIINVDEQGNNNIVVVSGANENCDVEYLRKHDFLFQQHEYVVFQLENPYDAVFYGISRAKELGKTTILNPAPAPDFLPYCICDKIDYLTPNETELLKLTGIDDISDENIRKGAKVLLDKGVKNVLVTLGSRGVYFVNDEIEQLYPAQKVKAVDTTAAGDCFNGALAVALYERKNIQEAIKFAAAAAAITVTRKGAQSSLPGRSEVENYELQGG